MSDALRPIAVETLLAERQWVETLARRLVLDRSTADDVVQETWLAAVESPPLDRSSPRGWLSRVVRNAVLESHRRAARRERWESMAPPPRAAASPADVVAKAESHRRVADAVMSLDEPYRAAVLLRFFEGLESDEVARRTGVPVETARTRIKRALALLRGRLDRAYGGDGRSWALAILPLTKVTQGAVATSATGGAVMAISMTTVVAACAASALLGALVTRATMTTSTREEAPAAAARAKETADAPPPIRRERRTSPTREVESPPEKQAAPAPQIVPRPADASASADALANLARAKADILQIEDAARRERGFVDFGAALRSDDARVARAALSSFYELRDVTYDKSRFRADVLRQLASSDAGVQTAAAYALVWVERDPGDLDRVLLAAEGMPVPTGGLLHVALTLSQNRVEGRLEKLFVKALAVDDPLRGAMDTANYLRGMWVSPAVEDAVVAAWRRRPASQSGNGVWPYVFGQMLPAARESRVRAVVELLASGDDSVRQLAGPVVTKPVDESARAVAAQLAAAGIAAAPTAALRRTYLDVIQSNGSREQSPALHALSDNAMVGDDLRALARKIADELDRGR